MCGIAGIIYRNGASSVGSDMTRMLQSMRHRGPNSTGYALYGPAGPLMHLNWSALANHPQWTAVPACVRHGRPPASGF